MLENAAGVFRIEIARGLVGENQLRPIQQGPRDGGPLLLARAELGRPVPDAVLKPELLQKLFRSRPVGLSNGPAGHEDVLQNAQVRHQMEHLKHKADVVAP